MSRVVRGGYVLVLTERELYELEKLLTDLTGEPNRKGFVQLDAALVPLAHELRGVVS